MTSPMAWPAIKKAAARAAYCDREAKDLVRRFTGRCRRGRRVGGVVLDAVQKIDGGMQRLGVLIVRLVLHHFDVRIDALGLDRLARRGEVARGCKPQRTVA